MTTTIQLGDRETATAYQVGDWVQIERHPKPKLIGQVVRVRSITQSGLLVVERPGQIEGDLVSANAVTRHQGAPPARDRVPLSDELVGPVTAQAPGLPDHEWEQIRAQAAPAIAEATGRRVPPVVERRAEPAVEQLAEAPVLLDERPAEAAATTPPGSAWDAELDRLAQRPPIAPRGEAPGAKPRRTQSEAHKRAIQEGKARKKAEREAAAAQQDRPDPGIALAAEIAQRRAEELTAKAEPDRLAREAARQAARDEVPAAVVVPPTLDPTFAPPLRRTEREEPLDLRPARLEGRIAAWEAERAMELAVPEFDLAQGARQLLMDALAAREPVVRLNPLIDWLQQLEQGDAA